VNCCNSSTHHKVVFEASYHCYFRWVENLLRIATIFILGMSLETEKHSLNFVDL